MITQIMVSMYCFHTNNDIKKSLSQTIISRRLYFIYTGKKTDLN